MESDELSVSVVIPTLNEQSTVRRAIESVAEAEQVLVVDGGSDDDTCAIASSTGATLLTAQRGRGRQLRAGAQNASGRLLLFMHADCYLAHGAISQLRDAARTGNGRAFGSFRQKIDQTALRYRVVEAGNAVRASWFQLPYGDQGIYVDRDTYLRSEGFPDVPLMEDVIFARRAGRLLRPQLLPGPIHVSSRRWAKQGVLRQTIKNWFIFGAFCCGVSPQRLADWYR